LFDLDPESLLSPLSKLFAASTTLQQLPGTNAGVEISIQGSVAEKLKLYLISEYGIPQKNFDIIQKEIKKKK